MPETVNIPITHDVPKCNCCGHIGTWKVQPILRVVDWFIGIFFMFFGFFPGLIYLGVVFAIRVNKNNRDKICRNCKAKNMFTFIY